MTPQALVVAACIAAAVLLQAPGGTGTRRAAGRSVTRRRAARLRALVSRGAAAGSTAWAAADPALVLELVAAALSAGAHPASALAVTGDAVGGPEGAALRGVGERMRLGAPDDSAWQDVPESVQELRRCLSLSVRTGAPASPLLRERAGELRRRRRRAAEASAQRLGVRLVLPLGLCALPAFAAWGVVPVVLGLAADLLLP